MFRKDYIQRQFEEFGKVMAVILGFKKNNELAEFELEIDKAVKSFTGLEIKELLELNVEGFTELISKSENLKPDQIKILADLFYEQAFVFETANNDIKLKETLARTYFLYEWYSSNLTANEFNIEINYRMNLLRKVINPPNQQ